MRKYSKLLKSGCVLFAVALTIAACKDDDPPVPPTVAFEAKTKTVKESDGTVQVKVVLDKAAPEDITVTYSLSGTAWEDVAAAGQHNSDYAIASDYKEVKILKGESEGIIELDLYSDTDLEEDETIIFSIDAVEPAEVTPVVPDDITITVQQEDGLFVLLGWGETGVTYPDVDMDLIFWGANTSGALIPAYDQFRGFAGDYPTNLLPSTTPNYEYFFLPGVISDGTYGISANYYSGTKEPMKFKVAYATVVNGVQGTPVVKDGEYALANINAWDTETGTEVVLASTFKKAGATFSDFSDITKQATGSRSPMLENGLRLGAQRVSRPVIGLPMQYFKKN
ncbi:Calx-beta domain-containing protein [Chryseolinea sp. T2]|uniref:Calx-beta domain-containing protein n=1 Tax=Chryseolinea sp. T2 TaxID=3129255 RepID=UPI003077122C